MQQSLKLVQVDEQDAADDDKVNNEESKHAASQHHLERESTSLVIEKLLELESSRLVNKENAASDNKSGLLDLIDSPLGTPPRLVSTLAVKQDEGD